MRKPSKKKPLRSSGVGWADHQHAHGWVFAHAAYQVPKLLEEFPGSVQLRSNYLENTKKRKKSLRKVGKDKHLAQNSNCRSPSLGRMKCNIICQRSSVEKKLKKWSASGFPPIAKKRPSNEIDTSSISRVHGGHQDPILEFRLNPQDEPAARCCYFVEKMLLWSNLGYFLPTRCFFMLVLGFWMIFFFNQQVICH